MSGDTGQADLSVRASPDIAIFLARKSAVPGKRQIASNRSFKGDTEYDFAGHSFFLARKMASSRENLVLLRFLKRPPRLDGGISLHVRPLNGRHVELHLDQNGRGLRLMGAALAVPHPSGLHRLRASDPEAEVVIVERISAGFDEAARELGLSYLDLDGHGRIIGPGFVYISSPPQRARRPKHEREWDLRDAQAIPDIDLDLPPPRRASASAFAPKGSRVVRALLAHPDEPRRLSEIARLVDLSPGHVHKVLLSLIESGHVERDVNHYALVDPGSLLEAWAEANKPPRQQLVLPVRDNVHVEVKDLVRASRDEIAVSGEVAAELIHPYLAAQSAIVHCIADEAWDRLSSMSEDLFPPRARAGRIVVGMADPGVAQFGEERDGLRVVHPVQLYVDLYRDRSRGREAANEIRRRVVAF